MAKKIVDQGLQKSLDNDYGIAAVDVIDSMCVSNFGTLLAGTTSVTAATNKDCNAFTATPTRAGNVVTAIAEWLEAEANFQITTITLHRDGAGVFTGVYGGVDAQSFTKTVDAKVKFTLTDTRSSV